MSTKRQLTPEQKAEKEVSRWRHWYEDDERKAPKGGWEKVRKDSIEHHRYQDVVLDGLSTRTRTVLHDSCFPKTKEQIKEDVISGSLDFTRMRNCGKKSIAEIFDWLGLLLKGQKFVTCPCCQSRLVYSNGEVFRLVKPRQEAILSK